jgi:SP family sugar:H+ symporter-like MFS transporter
LELCKHFESLRITWVAPLTAQLLAFFTPFITKDIDFRYGYVFAGCNALAAFIIYFFVIEGQGRTLEEIDTMYLDHVKPWESNKWVAPPPEEMARRRREAGTDLVAPGEDDAGPSEGGQWTSTGMNGNGHVANGFKKEEEGGNLEHTEHA